MKKFIPKFLINWYHFLIAFFSAVFNGFPSKKIKVIGITGTKGKSSTLFMAGKILEEAGFKVAWVSSLSLKIGNNEKINPFHMSMPGRGFIQKFLRKAIQNKCDFCLLEVTSEGIKQFRHRFINFDTVLLTNLQPEHIEAHGGFENYKKAKKQLFNSPSKEKTIIVNLDDENFKFYLDAPAKMKIGFSLDPQKTSNLVEKIIKPESFKIKNNGTDITLNQTHIKLNLLGQFNLQNVLAAIAIAETYGINFAIIKTALEKIKVIEGRMEEINAGQNFKIFVDLAHTPDSFRAVFETVKSLRKQGKIIVVFGAAGGGRDKWKRPELGKIASQYADIIVLTNEDPYEENPEKIIEEIAKGINSKKVKLFKIQDRREGIRQGLKLAGKDDIVLVLGKGTEMTYVVGKNSKPWDERKIIREELTKLQGCI